MDDMNQIIIRIQISNSNTSKKQPRIKKLNKEKGCRRNYVPVKISCTVVIVVYLTLLTGPPRIQPWSQDKQNKTKSNGEHVRRKKEGKQVRKKRPRKY